MKEDYFKLDYVNVISDANCMRQDGFKKVKKTIFERFTWRFWEGYKTVPNMIPTSYYLKDKHTIICHPSIKKDIEDSIEELI